MCFPPATVRRLHASWATSPPILRIRTFASRYPRCPYRRSTSRSVPALHCGQGRGPMHPGLFGAGMSGILDWSHHRPGGWYHCSVDTVKRSAGRSAVGAAAYATGTKLRHEDIDQIYDFSRKGGVSSSFTVAREHAPEWMFEPSALWNAAERSEHRSNSVVARSADIALPHRGSAEDGLGKKTRILDDMKTTGPQEITSWRAFVADRINQALAEAGSDERVDSRSLEAQGIGREATGHLGPVAAGLERKGVRSERGDRNRQIIEGRTPLDDLVDELAGVAAEITALEERRLDEAYGPAGDPSLKEPQFEHVAEEPPIAAEESYPRTAEEARAALDAETAPYEAYLAEGREIAHEAEGVTWWQRAGVYGWEKAREVVEAVRGYWQNFVESRRGPESDSPDQDGPSMER